MRALVLVALITWVRNPKLLGQFRADKAKGVTADEVVAERLLNSWHVTRRALASFTLFAMMSMFLDGHVRPGGRLRSMTRYTELVSDCTQI